MRRFYDPAVERGRIKVGPFASRATEPDGAFQVQQATRAFIIICSSGNDGSGWEHVSARTYDKVRGVERTPTWDEMATIKAWFWRDDEAVMQLHVPDSEHINNHPHVLHLWRPVGREIPRPPSWMIGLRGLNEERAS